MARLLRLGESMDKTESKRNEITAENAESDLLGSFRAMKEMNLGVPSMRVLEKYLRR